MNPFRKSFSLNRSSVAELLFKTSRISSALLNKVKELEELGAVLSIKYITSSPGIGAFNCSSEEIVMVFDPIPVAFTSCQVVEKTKS
ncbi:hypothetical protein D3C71_1740730 [compost metagenome]